ncbi:hypothetical protein B296_00019551 [Ensete ventricosum]|uniref:Uncharacterized protein n=1 Tax=Ensete ventricosum TaxID=4639 RepID=A0A426ZFX2_ENSVE|nr:hypothetical protein B296_00019551 [Ensete ventricosum]
MSENLSKKRAACGFPMASVVREWLLSIPRTMAATHGFLRALLPDPLLSSSSNAEAAAAPKKLLHCPCPSRTSLPISRRDALLISVLPLGFVALPLPSQARERRGRKAIAPEEYSISREFPLPILVFCTINGVLSC